MSKKKKFTKVIPENITVARNEDLVEFFGRACACGEHIERTRIINLLKIGLEDFPQVPIDHVFPKLIAALESIPAPQEWIDLQKKIIKSGLSQDEFEEDLKKKVYGDNND